MCVEAKPVANTTGLHVSIWVLGEAIVWQARLVLRLNAILSSYFNIFVLGTHPFVHHKTRRVEKENIKRCRDGMPKSMQTR